MSQTVLTSLAPRAMKGMLAGALEMFWIMDPDLWSP